MDRKTYLTIVLVAAATAFIGGFLSHLAFMDTIIDAQTFRLVDQNRNVRAELGFLPDGGPQFSLYNADGRIVTTMGLFDGLPIFSFLDQRGTSRLFLSLDPDGSPTLELTDRHKNPRVRFHLESNGNPLLSCAGTNGKIRLKLGLLKDESPFLGLSGRRGNVRALLGLERGERPLLDLIDDNSTSRILMGLLDTGDPMLKFMDRRGRVIKTEP